MTGATSEIVFCWILMFMWFFGALSMCRSFLSYIHSALAQVCKSDVPCGLKHSSTQELPTLRPIIFKYMQYLL